MTPAMWGWVADAVLILHVGFVYRSPEKSGIPLDIFRRLEIIESDFVSDLSFHGGSQKRSGLKLALWTWFSATIDTLVLVSLSCFFIVLFSFLMKASPGSMLGLFVKNQSFVAAGVFIFSERVVRFGFYASFSGGLHGRVEL